jgi:hypothetical protein
MKIMIKAMRPDANMFDFQADTWGLNAPGLLGASWSDGYLCAKPTWYISQRFLLIILLTPSLTYR